MSRRRIVWGGFVAALVILLATRCWLLQQAGDWLNVGSPLGKKQRVDYVYVLGGRAETRPIVAAHLWREGRATTILLPTPVAPAGLEVAGRPDELELMRGMLRSEAIPPEAIVALTIPVTSTEGEALALREYLENRAFGRVAIVTDDYHTRRTRLTFSRIWGAEAERLDYVSVPTDGFGPFDWWRSEAGLETYLLEFLKVARDHMRIF